MNSEAIGDQAHCVKNHSPAPKELLSRVFNLYLQKTGQNIKELADRPASWSNDVAGRYENYNEGFFEIGNWTSSFFTGMALLAWRKTRDDNFLQQTLRLAPNYQTKATLQFLNMHHDAGFLYSLYSVALYKLTGDKSHRDTGLAAAQALAQRFNHKGNFIRAWGRLDSTENDNMAIIDSLMNLPLLLWASTETGDERYHDIAVRHADMCFKYFVRPDGSVYHAFRLDRQTGQPIGPDNYCGWATDSHWARGTTWAIYGFALIHGYTRNTQYLSASVHLAHRFIEQLDENIVPMWDFRLTNNAPQIRDTSAAAIMVCAIQELVKHQAADERLLKAKADLLHRICQDDYLNFDGNCRGILKDGQCGRANNAYTSWGDYFLMEALSRELYQTPTWW